jgi:putative transposase
MIDRGHELSVTKQAEAAGIARSTVYYLPRPVSASDLELMRQIDKLHLEFPFAGARMLRGLLAANGSKAGRRHVKTLMKRMGIEALYRRPRTTKPEPGHKIYPYLLRDMEVVRPNQVWAMDITYIPMGRGFVYLAAVVDWFSRRVLSWRVSITMEASFCVEALLPASQTRANPAESVGAKEKRPGRPPLVLDDMTTFRKSDRHPGRWLARGCAFPAVRDRDRRVAIGNEPGCALGDRRGVP